MLMKFKSIFEKYDVFVKQMYSYVYYVLVMVILMLMIFCRCGFIMGIWNFYKFIGVILGFNIVGIWVSN